MCSGFKGKFGKGSSCTTVPIDPPIGSLVVPLWDYPIGATNRNYLGAYG